MDDLSYKKTPIEKIVLYACIFLTITFFMSIVQIILSSTTGSSLIYLNQPRRPSYKYFVGFPLWFIPIMAFSYTITSLVRIKTLSKTMPSIKNLWIMWLTFFLIGCGLGLTTFIFYLWAYIANARVVLKSFMIILFIFSIFIDLAALVVAWITYAKVKNREKEGIKESMTPPNSSQNIPKY